MKDKSKDTKLEIKRENKAWYKRLWVIVLFIIVAYLILRPSEEELCADAIIEAKSYLADSNYDLNEWMTYEYDLVSEEVTSTTITDTDCNLWDRNDIEVTFSLDVKTSKNRLAHIEAIVSVMDSYADNIEFNSAF